MRFPVNYIDVKGFFYDGYNINLGYCPENSNVYSIDDGEVIYAQYQSKYNNVVFIKHNNGLISMYKRLDTMNVSIGQKVNNGDIIGTIGSTIGSSKKFLLFGLFSEGSDYLNGNSNLDPFDYLYLYQNQLITNSTMKRYGVKIQYHESYYEEEKLDDFLNQNSLLIEQRYDESMVEKSLFSKEIFFMCILILIIVLFIAKIRQIMRHV